VGGSPIVAIIASVFLGLPLYMRMDLRKPATTSGMKGNMTTALRAPGTAEAELRALAFCSLF